MSNREIKFRAFDPRINTMYPFVFLSGNGGIDARLVADDPRTWADITTEHKGGSHHDYDGEIIIMQYTGLKDKNGVEIYEGDIVNSWAGLGEGKEYIRLVKRENDKPQINFVPLTGFSLCSGNQYLFEVIGNIYENPELLKEAA